MKPTKRYIKYIFVSGVILISSALILLGCLNFYWNYAIISLLYITDKPLGDFISDSLDRKEELSLSDLLNDKYINLLDKKFIISCEDEILCCARHCFAPLDFQKIQSKVKSNFSWSLFDYENMAVIIIYNDDGFYKDYTLHNTTSFCRPLNHSCLKAESVKFVVDSEQYRGDDRVCYRIVEG